MAFPTRAEYARRPRALVPPHVARQVNYFDMDTICDVKAPSWSGEDVAPMAEFLRGYADFVLRRTTQFGPGFMELLVRTANSDTRREIEQWRKK